MLEALGALVFLVLLFAGLGSVRSGGFCWFYDRPDRDDDGPSDD